MTKSKLGTIALKTGSIALTTALVVFTKYNFDTYTQAKQKLNSRGDSGREIAKNILNLEEPFPFNLIKYGSKIAAKQYLKNNSGEEC